jgi:hypothetical protein
MNQQTNRGTTMTTNETTIDNRFKAANDTTDTDIAQTLLDMEEAVCNYITHNSNDYEAIQGTCVLLSHLQNWLMGEHTDKDILEIIRISTQGTGERMQKAMEEL